MEVLTVDFEDLSEDYKRVEEAIRYVEEHWREKPSLKEIAGSVNLSEFHFQRLFTRWVGISPKRFLQYLSKEKARESLEQSHNVLEAAYEAGLSGPGRLHDMFVTWEAVTPGEYKMQGLGLTIRYGFHASPFGECLIATTERGVCFLAFVEEGERQEALETLRDKWAKARLVEDPSATRHLVEGMIAGLRGQRSPRIKLVLWGTNFQIKVWEALLRVPPGSVVTYEDIAVSIGMPKASRAVGNAVAHNPIPMVIPCHRVIRKPGNFGEYRYGVARKKAMVGWEFAQKDMLGAQAT